MEKIGLISDTSSVSLPLMKISAYHKKCGDLVEIVTNNLEQYDIVYVSKVFNLNRAKIKQFFTIPQAKKIIYGGSGYAIELIDGREVYTKHKDKDLPPEIENCFPDYSLFPEVGNEAHGFLTRGCPNNCGFCIVSKKDGLCSRKVADLHDF